MTGPAPALERDVDIETATTMLADSIQEDGTLDQDPGTGNPGPYIDWRPGNSAITLEGDFTADQLEAIAGWMRNNNKETSKSAN